MIRSMTGYGRAIEEKAGYQITAELRSVNARFLETSVRLPRAYSFLEDKIRAKVGSRVSRGKVDVSILLEATEADDVVVDVNTSLAAGYAVAAKQLAEALGLVDDFTVSRLMERSDIFTVRKAPADEDALWQAVEAVLDEAIDAFIAMRETEGKKLRDDVRARADAIAESVAFVEERSPQTVTAYREGLYKRMQEVLDGAGVDEARILQEAAVYADKVAVDEETVRLRSHLDQLRQFLEAEEPIGRKLDFLAQEMNREANTIGSKASDLPIADRVIDMKANIEKIREQIQNIE